MNTEKLSSQQLQTLLIGEVEAGLPLVPKPYAEIANRLGVTESQVINALEELKADGCIKRFGVIVRHRELGYLANAMVVWDVPDQSVNKIGELFGHAPFVTLCYRRPRRMPNWPYNLFTMIHGFDRNHVLEQVGRLRDLVPESEFPSATLFSGRRFKQRGARYSSTFLNPEAPKTRISSDIKPNLIT
ncbi:MAG: hypothetical protein WBM41_03690 [Arenicellales bacterium]